MFRPLSMQHVSLWLTREDAPAASLALAECGVFNPDTAERYRAALPDAGEQHYRDAYLSARSRLDRILAHCERGPVAPMPGETRPVPLADLEALDQRLGEIWSLCFDTDETVRRAEEAERRYAQLLQTLETFASLDLDLGTLLAEHRFLDVRVGTVPSANLPRLREALALAGFFVSVFASGEGADHCVIVGPTGRSGEVSSLLHTAGFHAVEVPPELRTRPRQAREELTARLAESREKCHAACAVREETKARFWPELEQAEVTLAMAAPYADMVQNASRGRGGLVLMTGWAPKRDISGLRLALDRHLARPYLLKLRAPERHERPLVPSVVRQPALLKSFARLVETYGVPRYGEVDPTLLFAVSFVLMFGMMFGDVGQGALLAAIGFALRGPLAAARVLMVSAGASSVLFGFLYGSVFGFEHLIDPVWMSPLHDPMRVLLLAVYWGVGFIVVASLIKTYNLYVQRGWRAALFDAGGVAGIALYGGAVLGVTGWLRGGGFGLLPALVSCAGAAAILVNAYREQAGTAVERAMVALIETLEAAIGFFANTLSFMRVGAFSLNHVALALAVFTIAEMLGGAGHWIAIVVGNVFIMVLEGAIVAIQALRLEYYEGFSRFFSGDGREFRPLHLGRHGNGISNERRTT
ncbi:MAG TPA: V-type ATPase 116kDa subunit family protein [Pelomicrobium sp.]|nr:V-type ATPase 116kDa subunit family protein [Pelomicrobium sp.]